jgi:hypothetical protein
MAQGGVYNYPNGAHRELMQSGNTFTADRGVAH